LRFGCFAPVDGLFKARVVIVRDCWLLAVTVCLAASQRYGEAH
jgi:hypothetical protein